MILFVLTQGIIIDIYTEQFVLPKHQNNTSLFLLLRIDKIFFVHWRNDCSHFSAKRGFNQLTMSTLRNKGITNWCSHTCFIVLNASKRKWKIADLKKEKTITIVNKINKTCHILLKYTTEPKPYLMSSHG